MSILEGSFKKLRFAIGCNPAVTCEISIELQVRKLLLSCIINHLAKHAYNMVEYLS